MEKPHQLGSQQLIFNLDRDTQKLKEYAKQIIFFLTVGTEKKKQKSSKKLPS